MDNEPVVVMDTTEEPRPASAADSARRWLPWLPVTSAIGFWTFCLLLYAAGRPVNYTHINAIWVVVIVVTSAVLCVCGFGLAERLPRGAWRDGVTSRAVVPWIGLAAIVLLILPVNRAYAGYAPWELFSALRNQADAYAVSGERIAEGFQARAAVVLLQTLLAPFTLVALPYFSFSFFDRRRHLAPMLVCLAIPVMHSILTGRDQQLGIMLLTIVATWALARVRRPHPFGRVQVLWLAGIGALGVLAVAVRKLGRVEGVINCPPGSADCTGLIPVTSVWDSTSIILTSYLSQGMEGLGRALEGTWQFGLGYSHSPALVAVVGAPPGRTVVTAQLPQFGWSDSAYWSTGFAGIANDVPWPLVPVVLGLIGLLLGMAWRSARADGDWLAVAVLVYTWIALVYMPLNLQLAISGPAYVGYLVLVAWFLVRWVRWARVPHPAS